MYQDGELVQPLGHARTVTQKVAAARQRWLLGLRLQLMFQLACFCFFGRAFTKDDELDRGDAAGNLTGSLEKQIGSFSHSDLTDCTNQRHMGGKLQFLVQSARWWSWCKILEINPIVKNECALRIETLVDVPVTGGG